MKYRENTCETQSFVYNVFMNLSCNLGGKEMSILASQQAQAWGSIIMWVVIMVVFVYFFMIRPQKKEAKKKSR